jgi:hypothetical protein
MSKPSEEWIEDCMHHHGIVLTGKYAHWCGSFDYLPIDETCFQFEYCECEWEKEYEQRTRIVETGA